ncbi:AraC family transcriptional regulator [Dongia sedimenti]|uniref:AraC family transcriptional regulator n=1 Tax=Dongia sedimenti TaxID=3064282 RepID=A0ABU0YS75_9PROT|nr:AraC family transcriptional regulator [Rhodospirillaceae bacterium R-7]
MDPLSDVLSLLKPRSTVSRGFSAGGDWAVQFGPYDGIKFNAIVSGQCWFAMDGVAEPVRLEAGDCFLLPKGRPFRLASDLALAPVDAAPIFASAPRGGVALCNGGGDFFLLGSRFTLAGPNAEILLGVLPPIVHLRTEPDRTAMHWSLDRMRQELREGLPGSSLVAEHLAHLMLVQALRLYLTDGAKAGVGWLFALADKQTGAAIDQMHADPAQRWTVQDLARHVGMSRTAFAVKFKQTVGLAPMDYLTRWRMLLAGDRLLNTRDSIAAIAASLGYESESAFGAAFRRVMGCSPRQYGRAAVERV